MSRVRRCRRAKERPISTLVNATSRIERSAANPLTTACAWCGDVLSVRGWERPTQSMARQNITHGICPTCCAKVHAERASMHIGKFI